jgi:hypothetical protein
LRLPGSAATFKTQHYSIQPFNSSNLLKLADIFFFVFHTVLTLFNLFGWAFRRTRQFNLITLLLTGFSWGVLGIFYGFGYCFLTDWHWSVREELGYETPYNSYIQFFFDTVFGVKTTAKVADTWTLILFLAALAISITLNIRDYRQKRIKRHKTMADG